MVLRSTAIKEIAGGFAGLFARIIGVFFNESGHDFKVGGVYIPLVGGVPLRIYGALEAFLSDEAAMNAAFGCKGAAGYRPCLLCRNVHNANTVRVAQHGDVPHSVSDWALIRPHTQASLEAIAGRLATIANHGTRAELLEAQTVLGWNWVPEGLLFDARLFALASPLECAYMDWMHVIFVGGVFNLHFGHLLHECKEHGITPSMLEQYVGMFNWPHGLASPSDVLDTKRIQSSWKEWSLKATASEGLSLYTCMALYFRVVMDEAAIPELRALAAGFMLLVNVIDLLQAAPRLMGRRPRRCIYVQFLSSTF